MEEKIVITEKSSPQVETDTARENELAYQKWRQTVTRQKESAKELKKEAQPSKPKEAPFKNINPFSSSSFKNAQSTEVTLEPEAKLAETAESEVIDYSSTIFTPNYDLTESLSEEQREKIFGAEQEEKTEEKQEKKRKWSIKSIVFAILFAIFGIWGIVNISTIDSLNNQIQLANETYNLNLANYLKNLTALDTANQENMENLFEVIPTDNLPPTSIGEQSNWFDRFCNFLAGLFGG